MTRRTSSAVLACIVLAGASTACRKPASTASDSTVASTSTAPDTSSSTTRAGSAPLAYAGYTTDVYDDPTHWLCRPGIAENSCDVDLDATVVNEDGSTRVEHHVRASAPKIDCFYVYPTISTDPTANSDLTAGTEEKGIAQVQLARFGEVCRPFAPVYRQNTLGSLFGSVKSDLTREQRAQIAYDDVLDAWKTYVSHDNHGRGFLLIGHSQGSGMLTRLLSEEIEPNASLHGHLVAAYLLGGNVRVAVGSDVGGDFTKTPLCGGAAQLGCVVAYSSFRATAPPPAGSFFGKPRTGSGEVACVDPAALLGDAPALSPYFLTTRQPAFSATASATTVNTKYVTFPRLLTGECVKDGGFVYLKVTVHGDPSDPRIDDVKGDLTPPWGLHLVDAELTMGDLVRLAAQQAKAYPTS